MLSDGGYTQTLFGQTLIPHSVQTAERVGASVFFMSNGDSVLRRIAENRNSNMNGIEAVTTSKRLLLNEKQVAHMAGISTSWLQKLRMLGEGPKFYKLGKAVRYSEIDVQRWIESLRAAQGGIDDDS